MDRIPKAGEFYRFFNGNICQVLTVAEHAITEEMLVIYQAMYDKFEVYAMPMARFVSRVDMRRYPQSPQAYYFEKIERKDIGSAASAAAEPEAKPEKAVKPETKLKEPAGAEPPLKAQPGTEPPSGAGQEPEPPLKAQPGTVPPSGAGQEPEPPLGAQPEPELPSGAGQEPEPPLGAQPESRASLETQLGKEVSPKASIEVKPEPEAQAESKPEASPEINQGTEMPIKAQPEPEMPTEAERKKETPREPQREIPQTEVKSRTERSFFGFRRRQMAEREQRREMFKKPIEQEPTEAEQANPDLMRFLDAETYEEKYKALEGMQNVMTDRLIDDIAVVLDVVIPEGPVSERYQQLRHIILTRQKYERNRFR